MHKKRKDSSRVSTSFWKSSYSYVYCSSSFRDLKLTDTCTTGTFACVEGAVAQCIEERWTGPVGTPCSESEQCFAVPVNSPVRPHSVVPLLPHSHSHSCFQTDAGIKLVCMAEETVASLITGAGATGDAFGGQN